MIDAQSPVAICALPDLCLGIASERLGFSLERFPLDISCHTTKEGDNRLGPNLHNIIGRKAGSLQNYGYSSAMKGADFVWDKDKLDRFIAKPDEVVPGNNMKPYGGLTSAEDRAKVIAFLESPTTN